MAPPRFLRDPAFLALVDAQDSVLSRRQPGALGITGHHLATRLRDRVWQRLGPNVVVLHGGPLSRSQMLWVAVLHGGRQAALSGLTAATADGPVGFESAPLTVVVPHGGMHDDLLDPCVRVRVSESRRLGPAEIHPAKSPPRTRTARSIVDAASTAATPNRSRTMLITADALRSRGWQAGAGTRRRLERLAAGRGKSWDTFAA